jgi:hypothetical protein
MEVREALERLQALSLEVSEELETPTSSDTPARRCSTGLSTSSLKAAEAQAPDGVCSCR